jgi:hypothetical protein
MLTFPANPAVGDQYQAFGNSWFWNNKSVWERGVAPPQPPAVLTSLNPTQAQVNDTTVGVIVTGTGFFAESVVWWDGVAIPTTFNSSTELQVRAPANAVAETVNVTVVNRDSAASNALPFTYIPVPPSVPTANDILPDTSNSFGVKTFTMQGSNLLSVVSVISDHPTALVISFALVNDSSLTFVIDTFVFNVGYWSFTPKNAAGDGTSSGAGITITP